MADPCSARPTQGTTDKREKQRKDARDTQDRSKPLLWDVLRGLARRAWKRDARKLIYEAGAYCRSDKRQDYRDH